MTEIGYIYCLTSPSGKKYIGQTWYLEKRYLAYMKIKCKEQIKLYRALKKYRPENFIYEIIDMCYTQEDLDYAEDYWINYFNTIKMGYNCRGGGSHGKNSEAMKRKMSKWAKHKFLDPNERLKASINNKKAWKDGKFWGYQNIEFYIDNVLYHSIKEASTILKIAHKTIHNRLNSINKKYDNYRYKDDSLIPIRRRPLHHKSIQIDDKIYDNIEDAVKDGYSRMTISRALKGIPTRTFKNRIIKIIQQ